MRILAIGAHPDDIEFACGGILLAEAARGAEIFLALCSRGEAGTNGTPDEREREARCAAGMLGAEIGFFDFGGDSHIERSNANALTLAGHIRIVRPDVLLGSVTAENQHPDHAIVGSLARDAARLARYGGIEELGEFPAHSIRHHFGYAVTPGAEPGRDRLAIRVDVSEHFARWVELMECHRSQLRTRNYIELQVARARLFGLEAGVEYAQPVFPQDDLLVNSLAELPPSVRLF
jgi:LmbE family N-acetylglucosaminyl deacetylase